MSVENSHHDGIVEHDNHLPNWWLATLFGAIVFAFVYWLYFHTLAAGASQEQELAYDQGKLASLRAIAAANEAGVDDATLLQLSPTEGAQIYQQNCIACHGAKGEGGVGPNLTDAYWLHGGKPTQIYSTIANGVIEKGMLAWKTPLGEPKVRAVAAYVLSLKNTNVTGKAPQGEKE